jgi:hypothetical protein
MEIDIAHFDSPKNVISIKKILQVNNIHRNIAINK